MVDLGICTAQILQKVFKLRQGGGVTIGLAAQGMLAGMPDPAELRASEVDGRVVLSVGATALFDYARDDAPMRNLAAVALRDLGFTGRRVGEVCGITEEYVSMLRSRVRRDGSSALTAQRGRPRALGARDLAQARRWRAAGQTDTAVGRRLGVHASTVARALGPAGKPDQDTDTDTGHDVLPLSGPETSRDVTRDEGPGDEGPGDSEAAVRSPGAVVVDRPAGAGPAGDAAGGGGSARIGTGVVDSRYAGAMLLYPYLHRVGAEEVFASLAGAPARRYDDLGVLTTATLGFALGIDTVEGVKHLRRDQAGAVVGQRMIPELATLRARLGALGDGCDPLATQRRIAAGMLAADPAADPVYFVDDHFVPYAGARPVAKGWNTKRRHAQPGRDDTVLTDARGRVVVFGSGEPTGLVSTLPGVLTQLREVIGPDAPILLGFDRGGAYPAAFRACRDAGAHWVTYRRAPLVTTALAPERCHTVFAGRQVSVTLADETVDVSGYGPARQLTLFEYDSPVLQVLTSDSSAAAAALLCWLRARWRIENVFKYASAHQGIDALADYTMDLGPDPSRVPNPARKTAKAELAAAQTAHATAERALAGLLTGDQTPAQKNAALPAAEQRIAATAAALAHAKTALRRIPAKIAATELDPDAQRARPRLARRGLQMVLRLLAFNAEAATAEAFNAYLADPDEHRAILRHLLHLGGQIHYHPDQITVTLDRPDTPRVAHALELLTDQLTTTRAQLPGDPRPLTYQLRQT